MTGSALVLACAAVSLAALLVVAAVALALPARAAGAVRDALGAALEPLARDGERRERALRDELGRAREEASRAGGQLRAELSVSVKQLSDSLHGQLTGLAGLLERQLATAAAGVARLTESNEGRQDALRAVVDARLAALQAESAAKLDEMRRTVDEQLQGTLERRLGESFRLVSERLEAVQRGLGEMQTLANGVGDLRRVLSNVKIRGTWGEVQLGTLLEQLLAPEQYAANVVTRREGADRVEFAIRLPGREDGEGEVLLPIDAKFPLEDHQRLVDAADRGDAAAVEEAGRQLELRLRACARDVHDKYLDPPRTTDFAILFLPTEGLYAEVVRRAGLVDELQRRWKISVAGPTTLAALLNALQMGFRTLAIQRRSSEVWQVLGAVKAEFGKLGAVLEKVDRKLQEASNGLQEVGRRRRVLERTLSEVQALPAPEAPLALAPAVDGDGPAPAPDVAPVARPG